MSQLPPSISELYKVEFDNSTQLQNEDMTIALSSHATMREEIKSKQYNRISRNAKRSRLQQLRELNTKGMEMAIGKIPANTLMTFQSDISVQYEPPMTFHPDTYQADTAYSNVQDSTTERMKRPPNDFHRTIRSIS